MKNFAIGHAFNVKDLFMNFKVWKLKISNALCKKLYPDGNKRDLAASIFITSVQMVINDIIDNNTHFLFPSLGKTQGFLSMTRTDGEKFKKAFKRGKWNDVDFLASNFSGYQLAIDIIENDKSPRRKQVFLDPKNRDKITENTNQGKQY